jgi:prepilin-type N-terminal cleavage/methylation domain-containing protein
MTRTRRFPRHRKAFTLVETLVALVIVAIGATIAMAAWQRTQEAAALRQATMQIAAVLRDAIVRTQQATGAPVQAGVAFQAGSGALQEYVNMGSDWQAVQPGGSLSLSLPPGVVVQSWSFDQTGFASWPYGSTAMRAQAGETDTGVYEQVAGETSPGSVTIASTHGMTATVHVTRAGTVWY